MNEETYHAFSFYQRNGHKKIKNKCRPRRIKLFPARFARAFQEGGLPNTVFSVSGQDAGLDVDLFFLSVAQDLKADGFARTF